MAYLGNAPARSFISFERQVFTIVNSQTAYTLDHSVNNENDIRLVVNNVVQEPGSGKAYTASGTTLTLSAALVNGTDEMYCVFLGRAVATNKPGAGSVGASQLASDAVTAAKLNDDIISGQTALGATPADTDEFLVSDAGTLKRVDYSHIKGLENWSESSGNLLPSDASYGIYLGVNSATAANLLDDYEEGTWTGTVSSGVFSYSKNTGYYRKVGNLVYVQIYLVTNGYTSGSRVSLDGLPFTSKNISSYDGHYPISCTRFTGVHENVLAVYPMINPGGTTIKTDTCNSAGSTMTSNNVEFFGAATHVRFAGCYITD
jgi:hypothetical protein